MPAQLLLDLGNTSFKAMLIDDKKIMRHDILPSPTVAEILNFVKTVEVHSAIIGSVVNVPHELADELRKFFPVVMLGENTALPVKNNYSSKESLGYDRIAAAIGGWQLFHGSNVLAIMAGTCITYNLIDKNNTFLGGAITPGIHMRAKAMHHFTEKLPMIDPQGEHPLIGKDTVTSLRSGVINGTVAEVKGMILEYEKTFPGLQVVIGGGDSPLLAEALKNGIFARPNLVFEGMHAILDFHDEKNLL
ncbi:MAG: type III pantothenate kinase [Bacteroidetes bacterium]|nr:type III pantothenate kinase [Bacteroidota bacterium]